MINQTLYPLAVSQDFSSKWNFQSTTVLQLFQLLHKEGICALSDVSPLFVYRASTEHWSASKDWGLNSGEACTRLGITLLKRRIGRIPGLGAIKKSILTAVISDFVEALYTQPLPSANASSGSAPSWGKFKMGSIRSSKVYTDGSFDKSQNTAGFAAVFADDSGATIKSGIPGHQLAIRAELFAMLAAKMRQNALILSYFN